jgi:hypothetical protein
MKPVLLLSTLVLAAGSLGGAAGDSVTRRGIDLFSGVLPLQGTIVGHSSALPPSAARCINCHAIGSAAPASAASAASFGPLLTPHGLTGAVARRGGPPSRYDAPAFCRLLRQGVDPAWVIVPRSMPRYVLTDADCHALWAHLTGAKRP